MNLKQHICTLKPALIRAAQERYDNWDQDDDGFSELLGYGGICDEIAEAMCGVLVSEGIDSVIADAQVGEYHVWVIAYDDTTKEAYDVDIFPAIYETGHLYVWKKVTDVQLIPENVIISVAEYETVRIILEEM